MPDWNTVDLGKLEQALDAPRQGGFGVWFYPDLADKTAILLYLMAKNHIWFNGNKRMALISTLVFLGLNGKWWDTRQPEARSHMLWIASSEARLSKDVIGYLKNYFRMRISPLERVDAAKSN